MSKNLPQLYPYVDNWLKLRKHEIKRYSEAIFIRNRVFKTTMTRK